MVMETGAPGQNVSRQLGINVERSASDSLVGHRSHVLVEGCRAACKVAPKTPRNDSGRRPSSKIFDLNVIEVISLGVGVAG